MKRIIILAVLAVLIPFFIISLYKKEEIKFNFEQNILVKVKTSKGIIKVPLEEYVVGVIAGEMPINFHIEALKAQAVAARTYVLKKISYNNEYDVSDNTNDQMYYTYEYLKNKWQDKYVEYINIYKKAVLETKGQYITYNNEIIDALYFSTSVGYTENSEDVFNYKPYLRSVKSNDTMSPYYGCSYQFNISEFIEKLGLLKNNILNIKTIEQTSTGRIKKIKINEKEYSGDEIKKLLNIKSNHFKITQVDTFIYIETKGYGHGVGMSQYGAFSMALNGYNYDEILKYYYQNIKIKTL